MQTPQFEFNQEQNAEFEELAAKARIAAIAIAALIVLDVISQSSSLLASGLWAIVLAAASFLAGAYSCYALFRSSERLHKITQSSGRDLSHLFAGLQCFENFFVGLALSILLHIVNHFLT